MAKISRSISLDKDIHDKIEAQSDKELRNFSNMVEFMAKKYFEEIEEEVVYGQK